MNVVTQTAAEENKKANLKSSNQLTYIILPAVLRRDTSAVCYQDKGQTVAGSLAAVNGPALDSGAL